MQNLTHGAGGGEVGDISFVQRFAVFWLLNVGCFFSAALDELTFMVEQ